jgi:hypothetical protein
MNVSNKTGLTVAFVVVVTLFLIFGFGTMSGSFMGGGMMDGNRMMGDGTTGRFGFGGYGGWMWFPTLLTLGIGVWLGWLLFGKKK